LMMGTADVFDPAPGRGVETRIVLIIARFQGLGLF